MASSRTISTKRERPGSQIFIGAGPGPVATPPDIPDLPEPPSPSESVGSSVSHLPSPPATNSTGSASGSTGDPASIALRSNTGRRPSISLGLGIESARVFQSAMGVRRSLPPSNQIAFDSSNEYFDDEIDDEVGEDDTARLGSVNTSLTSMDMDDENAVTLLRVKSLSERNRMALNKLTSISRTSSPVHNQRRSPLPPQQDETKRHSQSGSETEKESLATTSSKTHALLNGGTSSTLTRNSTLTIHRDRSATVTPPPNGRTRLVSAPASPGKALSAVRDRTASTARKRVSMASFHNDSDDDEFSYGGKFRESPTNLTNSGGGRRRNPLPKEFVEGSSKSPTIPSRRAPSQASIRRSVDHPREQTYEGRRQSLRGGSAESALFAVRSLGLTKRDTTLEERRRERNATMSSKTLPPKSAFDLNAGRTSDFDPYAASDAIREHRTGPVGGSLRVHNRDSSSPRDVERSPSKRDRDFGSISRPPTSLSKYQQAPSRPTSMTTHERDGRESPFASRRFTAPPPGAPPSASGSSGHGSNHSASASGGGNMAEHAKLLLDALNVLTSNLSRPQSSTSQISATSNPQILTKDAHTIVYSASRLNSLLRLGTTSALESQIDASTEGDSREAEIWKRVGGEWREALRVSDELVRTLTGFLLGVSRGWKGGDFGMDDVEGTHGNYANGRGRGELEDRERERERERDDALRRLDGRASVALLGRDAQPSPSLRRNREQITPPPATPRTFSKRTTLQRGMTMTPANAPSSASARRAQHRSLDIDGDELTTPAPPRIIQTKPSRPSLTGTPAERSRTLPPISIPKPLPTLPSESPSQRRPTTATGGHATGSTAASRARDRSGTIETPTTGRRRGLGLGTATPTTAVTPHHVSASAGMETSQSKERLAFPSISRQNSESSSGGDGLSSRQWSSTSSSNAASSNLDNTEEFGSVRRRLGSFGKSLDLTKERVASSNRGPGTSNAADRSAAASLLTHSGGNSKMRRKTVTEIWSNGDGN